MEPWIWIIGYVVGMAVCLRKVFCALIAWDLRDRAKLAASIGRSRPSKPPEMDSMERAAAAGLATVVALFWPLVVVLYLPYRYLMAPTPAERASTPTDASDAAGEAD